MDVKSTKAKDSPQVQKDRLKLQKKMNAQDQKIDDKAIIKAKAAMQTWISRHQHERVPLTDMSVELWDANRHPAKTKSKHVELLMARLQEEAKKAPRATKLKGRVTTDQS